MLICCNRAMVPIYQGIDYQCLTCVRIVEASHGFLICGLCGHHNCEHIRDVEQVQPDPEARAPSWGLEFHYQGKEYWHGTIGDRYYEVGPASEAEPKRLTSISYRERVIKSAKISGAAAASRKSGIPAATIRQWVKRSSMAA